MVSGDRGPGKTGPKKQRNSATKGDKSSKGQRDVGEQADVNEGLDPSLENTENRENAGGQRSSTRGGEQPARSGSQSHKND